MGGGGEGRMMMGTALLYMQQVWGTLAMKSFWPQ